MLRPDHLGDLMLSLPALQRLREGLPEATIGLLVGPWNREAAEHIAFVDEVLTLQFPWFDRRRKGPLWQPYSLAVREARRLRDGEWDTALVLRPDFWWGAMLVAMAGIPRRAGYETPETAAFLTQALPFRQGHESELALALAGAIAPGSAQPAPYDFGAASEGGRGLSLTDEDLAWASAWRATIGHSSALIAIHPGAGAPVKQWRPERWVELACRLAEEQSVAVAVTGAPEEAPLVEPIVQALGARGHALLGARFGQLAAVLQGCQMAIGVDSGIMHVAAALGVPTVRLYGPVDPARFGPWGAPESHVVVRAPLPCVPCNRLDYPPEELAFHPCVRAISVEDVLDTARPLLIATPALR